MNRTVPRKNRMREWRRGGTCQSPTETDKMEEVKEEEEK